MLLKCEYSKRGLARMVVPAVLALAPFLLVSCSSIRYDDSYGKKGQRRLSEQTASEAARRAETGGASVGDAEDDNESPTVPSKFQYASEDKSATALSLPAKFGIRLDDGVQRERDAKAARRSLNDPDLQPSYRELREARATAYAEADIRARGGNIYVTADGASSNPAQVKFAAAAGALGLRINASSSLNAVDDIPTALVLVVYHLSDRGPLDHLASTEQGMRKLLEGEMFDSSVKSVRQLFIQPGMVNTLALDRAEDGRYVAVVAGYNRPDARTGLFVTSYNIGEYKKKGETSFHRAVSMFTPLPLNLQVILGDSAMLVTETDSVYRNMRDSTRLLRRQTHYFEEAKVFARF